jgi:hypothetical protein
MPINMLMQWWGSPWSQGSHVVAHQLMHTLKNNFPVLPLHVQNALIAQKSGTVALIMAFMNWTKRAP